MGLNLFLYLIFIYLSYLYVLGLINVGSLIILVQKIMKCPKNLGHIL